jgi:hypothetical protein
MDVSRSEAQRAETNVIARSVDRATTVQQPRDARSDDPATTNGWRQQSLRKESSSSAQRTPILSAKDSNPFRKGLQSFPQRTPILSAEDCHPLRRNSRGRRDGRFRSRQNSATIRFSNHLHRPYFARHSIHTLASVSKSPTRNINFRTLNKLKLHCPTSRVMRRSIIFADVF